MRTKTIIVTTEWTSTHEVIVPEDWEYDGLESLVKFDDLSASNAELVDWSWKEAR